MLIVNYLKSKIFQKIHLKLKNKLKNIFYPKKNIGSKKKKNIIK